ncbi:hypothetical protein WG66_006595 [Moniliophthora roreri]|nr:hypothetical protein WG66_006595 [Moniliophthora roreri]
MLMFLEVDLVFILTTSFGFLYCLSFFGVLRGY